jgi:hypothetical protein
MVKGSTAPAIRTRVPLANSISIEPPSAGLDGVGASAIRTGANTAGPGTRSCRRQPYSWLGCIPACRAIADTLAPGSSDAATSCSFSAELHRRRRSTEVITSTRPLVM